MKKNLFVVLFVFLMSSLVFAEKPENAISIFPMVGYAYYPHIGNSNDAVTGGVDWGLGLDYAFLNNWTVEFTYTDSRLKYDLPMGGDKKFWVQTYGLYGAYWWEFTEGIYLKTKLGIAVNRGSVNVPYTSSEYGGSATPGYTGTQGSQPYTPPTNNNPPSYSLIDKQVAGETGTYYNEKYDYNDTVLSGGLALDFQINKDSSWGIAFDVLDKYIWDSSLYYRWTFM